MADFETTTDPNECRVWGYGAVDINNLDNIVVGNSLADFMAWCASYKRHTCYFHNLKFDGEFILVWLLEHGFIHAKGKRKLKPNTFNTLISDKGQFYSLKICFDNGSTTTFLDSLKILPFSVDKVVEAFGLSIKKLKIDYHAPRPKGHELTDEETQYIKNDIIIVAKALKTLFDQGLTKMTQGSNALYDYKKSIGGSKMFSRWFPKPHYDADIRQSYKGGYTYLRPDYAGKDIPPGIVLDANSLYPWVMRTQRLPTFEGKFFNGKYEHDADYDLYIQMFTCQFELKPDKLPTIQLKNNLAFVPTEYVTSSNGEDITLCLTNIDLQLFFEHYNVYNIEYRSGWKFMSTHNQFNTYIDKWFAIKDNAAHEKNGAMYTLSKLMLNALYGKFATNPNVRSKIPTLNGGAIKYILDDPETRDPVYIPIGTFVTAYARDKTIRAAQSQYHRFVYADTDSLHLIGQETPKELEIDKYKLGAWDLETKFTKARYLRAKSYVQEIDGQLRVTCAGMPKDCYENVTWENFRAGESFAGKKQMRHVPGGIVLLPTPFTLKA